MKKQARFLSFFMAFAIFATSLFTFNLNAKALAPIGTTVLPKGGSIVVDDGSLVSLSAICDNNFDKYIDEFNFAYFTSSDMKDIVTISDDSDDDTFTVSNSFLPNVSKWVVIDYSDYTTSNGTDITKYHDILLYPYSYDATAFSQGDSFELSSNSVLSGYDNFDASIYCGDKLLGEKTSTGNLKLPADEELKSSYSSLLDECGYIFPTATIVYYNCEVVSSDNNTCKLKLTVVPTHKISLVYPEELNMDDTVYYVSDSVPVNLYNIKIKPCDGYEYDNYFKEKQDYYNDELDEYVFAFTSDTDLHLAFRYSEPTFKLDTANKTISGFFPNSIVYSYSKKFTCDSEGKFTYTDDDLNSLQYGYFRMASEDSDDSDDSEPEIDSSYGFDFIRDVNVIPMVAQDGEGYKVTNLSDFDGQDVLFSWNGADSSSTPVYSPTDGDTNVLTVTYQGNENGFGKTYNFTISDDQTILNNSSDTTGIVAGPFDQEYFGTTVDYCGFYSNFYNKTDTYSNKTNLGPSTYTVYANGTDYAVFLKYDFNISNITDFKLESQNSDSVFHAGSTQKLTTTLTGEYLRDNKISYSVVGNSDSTTTVSADGTLTVGANETADSLTVIANYTPMEFKVATLTLVNKPLTSQTISSDDENISLSGMLSTDSHLIVSEIANTDSNYTELLENVCDGAVLGCYDIAPSGEYEGNLTLSFNVDDEYNGETLNLLHKKSDGTIEKLTGVVANGVVSFTVTSFSPFMLSTIPVTSDDTSSDDTSSDVSSSTTSDTTESNPETGANIPLASGSLLLLSASAILFVSKKSKK